MNLPKPGVKVGLPSTKTAGSKVQIGLPSLCSYEDDDSGDDEEKQIEKEIESNPNLKKSLEAAFVPKREGGEAPKKAEPKKAGLLSVLPPPRAHSTISFLKKPSAPSNSTSSTALPATTPAATTSLLLPRTLKPVNQQKTMPSTSSTPSMAAKLDEPAKKPVQKSSSLAFLQYGYDDSDDEESEEKYLKELEEKAAKQLEEAEAAAKKPAPVMQPILTRRIPVPVPVEEEDEDKCKFEAPTEYEEDPEIEFNDDDDDDVPRSRPLNINTSAAPVSQPNLDEEAWQKLCGGGSRKRKEMEGIELLDVSAKAIVGDATANLTKQITDEYRPSANRDFFSSGSKRKHQITYLAYVAKEMDQELRQKWADSKHNRAQSKMKYGF